MNPKGLYIHIPFCIKKCNYCDFLSFAGKESQFSTYVEKMAEEIRSLHQKESVDTIFFGGGTPSILSMEQFDVIMSSIHESFSIDKDAEISMECNPGTLSLDKLRFYKSVGINRISMGVQSFQNDELKALGRIHTKEEAIESYKWMRKAGFQNINFDLMSGIPLQTMESYQQTLACAMELDPEHISAYSLIIEENTPFFDMYQDASPVSEDLDREMYDYTKHFLQKYGYHRYEISNYAKKDYECKHNLKYWSGEDYLGIGLGACSKLGAKRLRNEVDLMKYIEIGPCPLVEEELTLEDEMSEFFILGLRKTKGVSLREFQERYGKEKLKKYQDVIWKFIKIGALEQRNEYIFFTDYGLDCSNIVLSEFL